MFVKLQKTYNRENNKTNTEYTSLVDSKETVNLLKSIPVEKSRYTVTDYEELNCNTVEEARAILTSRGDKLNKYCMEVLTQKEYHVSLNVRITETGASVIRTYYSATFQDNNLVRIHVTNDSLIVVDIRLDYYHSTYKDLLLEELDSYKIYHAFNLENDSLKVILSEKCKQLEEKTINEIKLKEESGL